MKLQGYKTLKLPGPLFEDGEEFLLELGKPFAPRGGSNVTAKKLKAIGLEFSNAVVRSVRARSCGRVFSFPVFACPRAAYGLPRESCVRPRGPQP